MENCGCQMEWEISEDNVHYYDMDQYVEVPSLKNQEYTPIEVIREILQENNLQKSI